jgi:signal peptidase I
VAEQLPTPLPQRLRPRHQAPAAWRLLRALLAAGAIGVLGGLALAPVLGLQTLIVQSGSMGRAAPTGSLVVVRGMAPADVEVGRVILMQQWAESATHPPVLHRVVERHVDHDGRVVVRTKGDENPTPDPTPYVVDGTVMSPILVIPQIGFALGALQTPVIWYGVVLVPAVLLSAWTICRIWATDSHPGRHLVSVEA